MTITRYRGDTFTDRFLVTNETTGDVVNLTGCTLYFTLNSESEPSDTSLQIYQLTGSVADPTSGVVEFGPNSTQVDRVGIFYYDIELIDANSKVRTLDKGTYVYKQDITKV